MEFPEVLSRIFNAALTYCYNGGTAVICMWPVACSSLTNEKGAEPKTFGTTPF